MGMNSVANLERSSKTGVPLEKVKKKNKQQDMVNNNYPGEGEFWAVGLFGNKVGCAIKLNRGATVWNGGVMTGGVGIGSCRGRPDLTM